jgi:RimJ/RimL family protein N-acetyltransferase
LRGLTKAVRIVESHAKEGSWGSLSSAIMRSLFRNDLIAIYVTDFDSRASMAPVDEEQELIRKGSGEDLRALTQMAGRAIWEFNRDRHDGVTDFFVCDAEGAIGHISWIYYRSSPNRVLNLANDEAEIKYSFTLEALRGRGLYPKTLRIIQAYLARSGFARVFICAHAGNHASIRGIEKAGFRLAARRRLVKVLGFQVTRRYSHLEGSVKHGRSA